MTTIYVFLVFKLLSSKKYDNKYINEDNTDEFETVTKDEREA